MIRTARISEVGAIDNDSATNEPLIGGLLGACTAEIRRGCEGHADEVEAVKMVTRMDARFARLHGA